MRLPKRMGMLLLGGWLVLMGAVRLIPALGFQGIDNVLAVLAIAAGVLIVLDR